MPLPPTTTLGFCVKHLLSAVHAVSLAAPATDRAVASNLASTGNHCRFSGSPPGLEIATGCGKIIPKFLSVFDSNDGSSYPPLDSRAQSDSRYSLHCSGTATSPIE